MGETRRAGLAGRIRIGAALGALLAITVATGAPPAALAAEGSDALTTADFTAAGSNSPEPAPAPTTIAETSASTASCGNPFIENPFSIFGDDRDYVLAPGGAFETKPEGWVLGRNTQLRSENEPWRVRAPSDRQALRIREGESVTSSQMCVDLDYPTFRLFLTRASGSEGQLRVDVIYPNAPGSPVETVGWLSVAQRWEVTDDIPVLPELGGKLPGGRKVAFRFTAVRADHVIDDLYVDPKRR
jgi:hypothetical protein